MIFRPVGPRLVAYGSIIVIAIITVVIGFALRHTTSFTWFEWATLAAMILSVYAGLHGVARSYVDANDGGLDILNGYKRHHLDWSEIKGIAMNTGAPWPTVVTKDDERVILFAIQGSDGPAARLAIEEIRRRIR